MHLTSASLPSLLPTPGQEKEVEELRKKLEEERKKYELVCGEKKNLEGELESLSQALFEEVSFLCSILSFHPFLVLGMLGFWTAPI